MIRRLDPNTQTFLTDLQQINSRVDRAERAVTSGRRINEPSDAPDELSNLLQLRTELGQTSQIRINLGRAQTEVDSAEDALQAAVGVLERAAVLGTQGANGTMTAEHRTSIAFEVENLMEQMVGLAQTRTEARYIFSGDNDSVPPFTLDLSLADPVSDYQGSAATREMLHPAGTKFRISMSGDEIFDNADPTKNVQESMNNLRIALQDNDESAIKDALDQISSTEVHLNGALAFYGAVQNKVAAATDFAYEQELRLKTRVSEIEDADMTASILELNQARYQQEVSLTAKSKDRPTSLFDYIG